MPLYLIFHSFVLITSLAEAISTSDREMLTFLHVSARVGVQPPAVNMRPLLWSSELEKHARFWAKRCSWGFPDPAIPEEKPLFYVGINIAMISTEGLRDFNEAPPSIETFFNLWDINRYNFDFELNICRGGYCGQYRQIIWADTEYLGCERSVCDQGVKRHVLVCCYYPSGNYSELQPYQHLESEGDFPLDEEPWIMQPYEETFTRFLDSFMANSPSALVLMCFLAFLLS